MIRRPLARLALALCLFGLTAPAAAPAASFLIGGDARNDKSKVMPWAITMSKEKEGDHNRYDAFIFLGDMELTPQLDSLFLKELHELTVPFYPILGNHEVLQFGGFHLFERHEERDFHRKFLGTRATPVQSKLQNSVYYGALLPGGVYLLAVDNVSQKGFCNPKEVGAHQEGVVKAEERLCPPPAASGKAHPVEDQLAEMEKDLAAADRDRQSGTGKVKYIIVGMHKALAKNGRTGHSMDEDGAKAIAESDLAMQIFQRHHVDVIFASHDHLYAHIAQGAEVAAYPQGYPIETHITGGLGAPLDHKRDQGPFHHVLRLDTGEEKLKVTVVPFPDDTPDKSKSHFAPKGKDGDQD